MKIRETLIISDGLNSFRIKIRHCRIKLKFVIKYDSKVIRYFKK